MTVSLPPLTASVIHHVGMSVASLDRSLAFWEALLGSRARWRGELDRPYLGRLVGYPGVHIDAALLALPGGAMLELLEYRLEGRRPNDEATANPGNVHLCLAVEDADSAWRRAVALGARPVEPRGPVEIDAGPNRGARVAYLRDPDGITFELYQPAAT